MSLFIYYLSLPLNDNCWKEKFLPFCQWSYSYRPDLRTVIGSEQVSSQEYGWTKKWLTQEWVTPRFAILSIDNDFSYS